MDTGRGDGSGWGDWSGVAVDPAGARPHAATADRLAAAHSRANRAGALMPCPTVVVLLAPVADHDLRFGQAEELLDVEQLVTPPTSASASEARLGARDENSSCVLKGAPVRFRASADGQCTGAENKPPSGGR